MIEVLKPHISQMCATATHYCVLGGMIAKTTGNIVEFGIGHYSTPLLHFAGNGRRIISIDTDSDWCGFFAKLFKSDTHEFHCTEKEFISQWYPKNFDLPVDVLFVDNSPSEDRVKCIEMMRKRAKYIVVHDSEPLATCYNWGNIFDTFKHKFYWDFYGNGTMVVSDFEEIGLK